MRNPYNGRLAIRVAAVWCAVGQCTGLARDTHLPTGEKGRVVVSAVSATVSLLRRLLRRSQRLAGVRDMLVHYAVPDAYIQRNRLQLQQAAAAGSVACHGI